MYTSLPRSFRLTLLSVLAMLLYGPLSAQDTLGVDYPWNLMNLTDHRMKPGVVWVKVPPPRGGTPIWIPIGAGALVTGGVILLLDEDEEQPGDRTPLILRDDQITVDCGEDLTFNPLLNDQGDGLVITNVTSSASVQINWDGTGEIRITNLPSSGSVSLTVFVNDSQNQSGQETVNIQINSPNLTAMDDAFATDFETPLTFNVLTNDQGSGHSVSDHSPTPDGELTFDANGAFTFVPNDGFSGETSFTYSLTDRCGQIATATVKITVGGPDCSFSVQLNTTPTECGLNSGAASAIADPPGNYSYSWSNGSTLSETNELAAGEISVTVTSEDGSCSEIATATVDALPPSYLVSISATAGNCLGEGADIVLTTDSPANGPMNIQVEGGPTLQVVEGEASLASLFSILPGTYTLGIYDISIGESCIEYTSVTVPDNSTQPQATDDNYTTTAATAFTANALNNDSGLNITMTQINEVVGGTVSFEANGQFTFEPFPDFIGEGGFTYTLTDACGVSTTARVSINVLPPDCDFTVGLTTTPSDCGMANGTASASVSEPGDYSYNWSNGSTGASISNLAPGNYAVTVSTLDGVCSSTGTGEVAEIPVTYIETVQITPADCLGNGADIEVQTSIVGSGTLTVTYNGVTVSGLPQGNLVLSNWFDIQVGDFSLSIYDSFLGEDCSETELGTVPENTTDPIAVDDEYSTAFETTVGGNVLDNDEGTSLSVADVFNIVGGTVSFLPSGDFTFSPLPGFSGSGEFTYLATDICGVSVTAIVTITVETSPCNFTITTTSTAADCGLANGSATASVDEPGEFTFIWSDGQVGAVIESLYPGTYTVTATEGSTGCTAVASVTVDEIPGQYITDLVITAPSCDEDGEIHLIVATDFSPTLIITIVYPGGDETIVVEPDCILLSEYVPITPGNYTITVQDPLQGHACAEIVGFTLGGTNTGPGLILLEAIPPSGATASDGALVLLIEPYTTPPFDIFLNGVLWGSTIDEVFTIFGLPAGPYIVQVTDASGCSSNQVEAFLLATQPLVSWETLSGRPLLVPQTSSGSWVEHPTKDVGIVQATLGTQLSITRSASRWQLAVWQAQIATANGQFLRANWQRGWQGNHWSIWTGPAVGHLLMRHPEGSSRNSKPYGYWSTDLSWRPAASANWCVEVNTAIGQQNGWWHQSSLGLRVLW